MALRELTKARIALYLAVIFLAGAISGAALGWRGARQRMSQPPSPQQMRDHLRDHLHRELHLTAEQQRQLEPILQKHAEEMKAIHGRTVEQIEARIRAFNEEITRVLALSPEQKAKLDELERRRQEMRHKKPPRPNDSHRPPPGEPGKR
jgi:Spy/CpxP family protein refolding chaperone